MRRMAVVMLVALLAGCQTQQVEEMNYTQRKQLAEVILKRCYAQGVKPGSREIDRCAAVEVESEIARRRNNAIRAEQARIALANGMGEVSDSYARAAQQNRPVNCTSTMTPANTVRTTCY